MRNYYFLLLLTLFVGKMASAQTYVSDTTAKQFITSYGQTFTFTFTGLPAGGWGNATLVVYFEGDFGDSGEFGAVADEDATSMGQAGPYSAGFDCAPRDSVYLTFNAANIDTWMADSQVDFTIAPSGNVDPGVCTIMYFQCRLIYNYCAAGTPQEFATFVLADSIFCSYDAPITLSGTPAGGTFSGIGVSGNQFNPSALAPGASSSITYTATDGIGCITDFQREVRIMRAPNAPDTVACPGTAPELSVSGGGVNIWFYDPALTQAIDTANIVFADPITSSTTYYVATVNSTVSFFVDSMVASNSAVVDHNITTGDDRGGIAITEDYIFVVGDNSTVRANASDLGGQVSLPIQDALFSDLLSGNLYTLWNTTENVGPSYNDSDVPVNAIRGLDNNMVVTSEINPIDMEIPVAYGSTIFAGAGYVGIYSAVDMHVYIIDLDNYSVQDLGAIAGVNTYGSENWARWGVLEYDGFDFFGVYRSNVGNNIVRHNFTSGTVTTIVDFPSGISDMASLTVSPWNDRWYFHYEGGSATFGGSSETMGYADAGTSSTVLAFNELGCYSEVDVFVNQIDLGNDTTICENSTPYVLFAGLGFESYTWNGVNNNYNAFPVSDSGMYIVEAVDDYNCTIVDTIQVSLDPCVGLDELANAIDLNLFPNPTSDNITLSTNGDWNGTLSVSISDLNGKTVLATELPSQSGYNEVVVDTQSLNPGVYMVRISHASLGQHLVRLVKQ